MSTPKPAPKAKTRAKATPKAKPVRRGRPPKDWHDRFIDAMASMGNVGVACQIAGVDRRTVYRHRKSNAEFNQRWETAIEEACDVLEREAWRRATVGVPEPVYQRGAVVGTVTRYSDRLLEILLRANMPRKYLPKYDAPEARITVNVGEPATRVAEIVDELAARRRAAAAADKAQEA